MSGVLTEKGSLSDAGYDKVTQASLNGIYVKAQELDRGHNDLAAPFVLPPGSVGDAVSRASDSQSHASARASDSETHATTHASEASGDPAGAGSNANAVALPASE